MIGSDRSTWTVRDVARWQLREFADRPFVEEVNGERETYRTFISRSVALAHALAVLGVRHGDGVAILCQNGIPSLHAWMGASLLGAFDVPINPFYRGDLLRHVLTVAKPQVIVADVDLVPALSAIRDQIPFIRELVVVDASSTRPVADWTIPTHSYAEIIRNASLDMPEAEVRPSDIASVMFTSGTTGPSKGVMIPNGQACLLARQPIDATRMNAADVFYCAHPMNHIAGKFMGVFATFATGGRVVLDKRFEAAQWLDKIRHYGITVSIAHGPMIEMIFQTSPRPDDRDHAMRRLMCCPLPKHIAHAFEERFATRGVEMWGMTEVACPCWTPLEGPRVDGSCGRVLSEWYDVSIIDPDTDEALPPGSIGEIAVRPHYPWTIMQGYLGMPVETLESWRNMWFHTGDAAYRDADGNFFYVDRIKDRIRRRAENISSYDIEAAANQYPGVRETAAVGVASGFEGDDDIKLYVAPHAGATLEPLSILTFLSARLPHAMVPRYIELLDALPRTPTNKVKKRELRTRGITAATWDRHKAGVNLRELSAREATSS